MRRAVILFLLAAVVVTLAACSSGSNEVREAAYQDGLRQGYEDAFSNLWAAAGPQAFLDSGSVWETDYFSLYAGIEEAGDSRALHLELTAYDRTVSECFEDWEMLFYAFSYSDGDCEPLLTDDLFYMFALLEHVSENTAHATVALPESAECVLLLIAVDGSIHKAVVR